MPPAHRRGKLRPRCHRLGVAARQVYDFNFSEGVLTDVAARRLLPCCRNQINVANISPIPHPLG